MSSPICKCINGYTPFNQHGNCRFCFGINPSIKKIIQIKYIKK